MNERKKKILKTVAREFRRTGQPVASRLLISRHHWDFSPATMRAEMLALDQDGFLEQPHISAGRVPTDKAWRFLINDYLEEELAPSEKTAVRQKLTDWRDESVGEIAHLLSECTKSLVISASFGQLADFRGSGFRWLADEPEFADNELRDILKCFDLLENQFSRFFSGIEEEVKIFIGEENPIKELRFCSLMVARFERGDNRGVLGVLGPKRMDYQRNKFILEETRKKIGKNGKNKKR